jgi:hypothetical protein
MSSENPLRIQFLPVLSCELRSFPAFPESRMAKEPRRDAAATGADAQRAKNTKTCQMYEDVIFWASVLASFNKSTIAKVIDPIVRDRLKELVREKGVDPDAAWAEAQEVLEK